MDMYVDVDHTIVHPSLTLTNVGERPFNMPENWNWLLDSTMKKRESLSPSPKKSGLLRRERKSRSSSSLKKSPEDKSSPQSSPRKHGLRQLICSKISPSSPSPTRSITSSYPSQSSVSSRPLPSPPSPSRSITRSYTSQTSDSSKDDTSPIKEEKIFGTYVPHSQQMVSSRPLPSPPSPSRSITRSYTSQTSGSSKSDVSPIREEKIFGSYVSDSQQTVSSRARPSPPSPSGSINRSYTSSYTSLPSGFSKGDASPIRGEKIFGSYSHSQQTGFSKGDVSPMREEKIFGSYASHSQQRGTVSPIVFQYPWTPRLIGTASVTSPSPPQSPQRKVADPQALYSSTGDMFRSYTFPKPWNPLDPGSSSDASVRQEQVIQGYSSSSSSYTPNLGQTMSSLSPSKTSPKKIDFSVGASIRQEQAIQSYASSSSSYTSHLGQTMSSLSPSKTSPKKIGFSIDTSARQEQAVKSYTSSSSSYTSNLGQTMSSLSPTKTSPKKIGISGTVLSNSPSPSGGKFRSYTTNRPWSPNLPGSPQYSGFDEFTVQTEPLVARPKPTQNPWNFQQMESALPLSPSRSIFGSSVQRPQSLGLNFSETSTSSSDLQRMHSSLFSSTQRASPESPSGTMYYETTHIRRSPRRLASPESPSRTTFSYSDMGPTLRNPRRQALTFYEPEEEDTDLNKSFLSPEDYH